MINNARNMALDFLYGQADGSVTSLAPDRGGVVETENLYKREAVLRWGDAVPGPTLWPVNGTPV
jgi:hypothetical protein